MWSVPRRRRLSSTAGGRSPASAPVRSASIGHAELGGDHHLVAALAQRPAQELLALGAAVDVGGVEEGDAGVEGGVRPRRRGVLVDPAAEVVAAQPDHRHLERTDVALGQGVGQGVDSFIVGMLSPASVVRGGVGERACMSWCLASFTVMPSLDEA